MRIAIVGTGYVGLVSAACFAELGHEVIGVDIDEKKVRKLRKGKSPIYEPGLEELIQKNLKARRLSFTTKLTDALPHVAMLFTAVATPPGEGYRTDLKAVYAVCDAIAASIDHDLIVVNKSTVPVGTGKLCEERIAKAIHKRGKAFSLPVISNPEFLREGMAVTDTLMPDRIVVGINGARGVDSHYEHAVKMVEELYRPITRVGKPLLFMSRESAEIVKYGSNALLSTKISFINMMAELAEVTGANVRDIARGIGLDDRIGPRFLHAGIGYGGSCFPKDVKALLTTGRDLGIDMSIVEATDKTNIRQRYRFLDKILKTMPKKSRIGIWGVSYKPKTDDMREAPSLDILPKLIEHGHTVVAYDPAATPNAEKLLPKKIKFVDSPMKAAKDAHAVVLLTEWDEFRGIDLKRLMQTMQGNVLFDGRNVYEPSEVREAGLKYVGMGMG